MRKLLIGSAAIVAAAVAATPADAQFSISIGSSPYSYGYSRYGYSPYSYGYSGYGYSPYSYGYSSYGYSPYSYSPYGYGYSYPSYGYGYSPYGYRAYSYRSSNPCLRRHHRNGIVYYTRVC
jgi:hypothetical protein